jgi:phosphohistidine phosphatase
MYFYLVRHGEAVAEAAHPRRPLNDQGRAEVERVARAAAKKGVRIHQIFHSGKVRAKETAEVLDRHLSPSNGLCEIRGLGPLDDPLLARAEAEAAENSVMLVGHLPHLSRLASLLISGDPERKIVDFPSAAMVCLSYQDKTWEIVWTLDPASA